MKIKVYACGNTILINFLTGNIILFKCRFTKEGAKAFSSQLLGVLPLLSTQV